MGWELRSCREETRCPEWTGGFLLPRSRESRPAATWGGPQSRELIGWPGLWSHYTCDAWWTRGERSVFIFSHIDLSAPKHSCSYLMRVLNWCSLPGSLFSCLEIVITSSSFLLLGCWGLLCVGKKSNGWVSLGFKGLVHSLSMTIKEF